MKLPISLAAANVVVALAIALSCALSPPVDGATAVVQVHCAFDELTDEWQAAHRPELRTAKVLLNPSPYEKFHWRIQIDRGLSDGGAENTAIGDTQTLLRKHLSAFSYPDDVKPHVVLDLDRGDLAIEVAGLDRASAQMISKRLSEDLDLQRCMLQLGNRGIQRVHADISSGLKVSFLDGGELPYSVEKFRNGKKYRRYHYEPGAANTTDFKNLVDDSVEVLYMPKGPWGHLAVRVGTRYYSYGMVGKFVSREFLPFPGGRGYGFKVSPAKIAQVIKEMDTITENASKFNVPPYDVYALQLELLQGADGKLRYRSDTPDTMNSPGAIIRNNEPVNAKLIKEGDQLFLKTATGFRYPVQEIDGRLYVESINCVNAVRDVAKRAGIDLGLEPIFPKTVTESVERILAPGNIGGTTPDFVVDYAVTDTSVP